MPSDKVTQIMVGGVLVGLVGLEEAILQARPLCGRPDEEIASALLAELRKRNYIPPKAEEEYRKAFVLEFKKAMGERVQEETSGICIKIVGAGCPSCESLEQMVLSVLAELGLAADVHHVRDRQAMRELGVAATPALVIDGTIRAAGTLPARETLKQWLVNKAG
jgi:small redox-active disulfide protein 2